MKNLHVRARKNQIAADMKETAAKIAAMSQEAWRLEAEGQKTSIEAIELAGELRAAGARMVDFYRQLASLRAANEIAQKADPATHPKSTRQIDAFLKANGLEAYHVKRGGGYHYVWSDDENPKPYGNPAGWYTSSIPVCYAEQLTLAQWLEDVNSLGAEGLKWNER
jgi:hypothetical protein